MMKFYQIVRYERSVMKRIYYESMEPKVLNTDLINSYVGTRTVCL